MKKIIFDIDDTLLMFDPEYIKSYQKVLEKNHYEFSYQSAYQLFKAIGKYEYQEELYEETRLLKFINRELKTNYSMQVVLDVIEAVGEEWVNSIPPQVKEVLVYLSQKYDLCILTNWFTNSQKKRLEKLGIESYFKEIVGGDKVPIKPRKEAFLYFGNPSDCIMIGDRLDIDIEGALNVGMRAILYDFKKQHQDVTCERIENFEELKEIL